MSAPETPPSEAAALGYSVDGKRDEGCHRAPRASAALGGGRTRVAAMSNAVSTWIRAVVVVCFFKKRAVCEECFYEICAHAHTLNASKSSAALRFTGYCTQQRRHSAPARRCRPDRPRPWLFSKARSRAHLSHGRRTSAVCLLRRLGPCPFCRGLC